VVPDKAKNVGAPIAIAGLTKLGAAMASEKVPNHFDLGIYQYLKVLKDKPHSGAFARIKLLRIREIRLLAVF
jgi:hypothetical protein